MLRIYRIALTAILAGLFVLMLGATQAEAAGNGRGNGRNLNDNRAGNQPSAVPSVASADSAPIDCLICDLDVVIGDTVLDQAEIDGLLLALNDEYHAAAIYAQVLEDFGAVRPFSAILRSEQQHAAALIRLFDLYGLSVPDNVWLGQVPSFDTVPDACAAAVQAELLNVDLYVQLYASTDRSDIEYVYQRLQTASQNNHLPAFSRCAN